MVIRLVASGRSGFPNSRPSYESVLQRLSLSWMVMGSSRRFMRDMSDSADLDILDVPSCTAQSSCFAGLPVVQPEMRTAIARTSMAVLHVACSDNERIHPKLRLLGPALLESGSLKIRPADGAGLIKHPMPALYHDFDLPVVFMQSTD